MSRRAPRPGTSRLVRTGRLTRRGGYVKKGRVQHAPAFPETITVIGVRASRRARAYRRRQKRRREHVHEIDFGNPLERLAPYGTLYRCLNSEDPKSRTPLCSGLVIRDERFVRRWGPRRRSR